MDARIGVPHIQIAKASTPDFKSRDSLAMPWTESPFFYSQLYGSTDREIELARSFHENGYVVIDLDDIDFEQITYTINDKLKTLKTQESGYHYSEGPRIFEAWKWNEHVLKLCKHPKILSTLKFLYGRDPMPFQTINFKLGTNQPLHSDTIHFHSVPERWVAAVWVALEPMDDQNGTLSYVPGSHKLPIFDFQDLKLPRAEYGKQFESYAIYEDFIARLVAHSGLNIKKFYAKKGQALIWSANLIHGGSPIKDPNRTRWSQAIHYYFEGCSHYYSPMFSDASNGIFSEKDLSTKDIIHHTIHAGE